MEREGSSGIGGIRGWKGGWEKLLGLGSESRKFSVVSTSELLKLELVLKIVRFESSESMRGE